MGACVNGAYYNEHDPVAAAWLRNLIAAGHIAAGDVDERDIRDVHPDDLRGYTQCHFFAGVGVWSYALRRAGWPDDRPVWTGSCPCQPFSAAGKGLGFDDERHLWPAWYWLIGERLPAIILGEQVASSAVDPWIDLVHADMEALDYAYGCVPFPSAGVGASHIRDRAYWMADADGGARRQGRALDGGRYSRSDALSRPRSGGDGMPDGFERIEPAGPTNGFWRAADWLLCRDGKWRPVEPGTFPLAHGAPSRVGRLRAYGNAINAEAAVAWIKACGGLIG
ncbi:methyltransferase [Burkholderia mayonis]|uniref:Methyltransferase n=2 Tax=Burkholderia mayonis TaxID=1385591 RepID=A0A1B4G7N8_9BURK|nr:methyltransferase [Burkholderia mayonis]KVE53829.1 methyltransferase [Burkholderia mayonis]